MGLTPLLVVDESGLARLLLTFGFTFFVPGRAIVDNCSFLTAVVRSCNVTGPQPCRGRPACNSGLMGSRLAPAGAVSIEAWLSVVGLGVGARVDAAC